MRAGPEHESLPSPHAAVNHSFLQGIWAVSTPSFPPSSMPFPPCVLMRGLESVWSGVGVGGGWKKEGGGFRLMPQGLGPGSSASQGWDDGGKAVLTLPSYTQKFKHFFLVFVFFFF